MSEPTALAEQFMPTTTRIQFSLRRWLVLVTLAILVVGAISRRIVRVDEKLQREKNAIAAIERAGGRVGGYLRHGDVWIDFSNSQLTDSDLKALLPSLQAIDGLKYLKLSKTQVSSVSAGSLIQLNDDINVIDLSDTKIQRPAIAQLKKKFPTADILSSQTD
jgi:hypothetical protein